ncbi:3-oxoacyl-[acyl-carrier-protein] synthase 3 [Gordonia spumicola]|uniref:3-oxoacyl-[acyl-carrier-protein] synthase 3 n=1 Tax=Gordonia spumicola TaxID=589161 RepID=A0A7I9V5M8_9ACTN|nr:3-oxoacyl-[acyl-carrier-protein] synthase 3 [Gordonia spumicola]
MLSVGTYRPPDVVTNDRFRTPDASDPDLWLRRRTGITTRHYAGDHDTVASMAVAAARRALDVAGTGADDVDTVIVATSTHMLCTPPAAAEVAYEIGTTNAAAFDLSAGCSGFTHALAVAADLVSCGTSEHVLVIGSEKLTPRLDPDDVYTAPLFGDGAGAVLVGPSDRDGIGRVAWGSDGGRRGSITQTITWDDYLRDRTSRPPVLAMDGPAVFRWAVELVPQVIAQIRSETDVEIKAFIPHQANRRITEAIARSTALPPTVAVADDVTMSGNTSAASIPLAMQSLLESRAAAVGDVALIVGFGAGLCWAGQLVELPAFLPTTEPSTTTEAKATA